MADLAVSVWVAATRWEVLGGGHPADLVLVVLVGLAGIVLLGTLRRARVRADGRGGGGGCVLRSSSATTITLWPAWPSGAGLVFQPGARVDPRAYVGVLTPVAAAGHLVVIVKQPLGIALLASGASRSIIAEHPQVRAWAVGGHSLGGVVAAQDAAAAPGRVRGLVLWAAYPVSSLAGRTDLAVSSVSGSADALARACQGFRVNGVFGDLDMCSIGGG